MRYSKRIITLAFALLAVLSAGAQDRLYVYRHALTADTLLLSDVASISHSRLDLAGTRHDDFVTMNVALKAGTTRQYLLTAVDSVVMERDGQRLTLTEFCGLMTAQGNSTKKAPRRTSLSGDFSTAGEPVDFFWEDGDHLYLADGRRDIKVTLDRFTSPTDSLHAEQASFFFGGAPITANEVTVYYPGQAPLAYNRLRVNARQTQSGVSSSMHLGMAGDCGTAVARRQDDGSYRFTLEHRAAYLCFLPCIGNSLGRTELKQITVRSDSAIAGIFTLTDKGLIPAEDTTHVITLTTADFILPERSSAGTTAFMVLAPQNGPLRLTCEFTVFDKTINSTGTYTKTLDLQKVEPNMLYLVKANLNNYVCDLGLPYKIMNHNMGATAPEEYGGYYAFGELEDKGYFSTDNYAYLNKDIGSDIKLTQYDVAHVRLGQDYSMPTIDELYMLRDSCTGKWTTINGHNGYLITGKNGNSIFMPAAGFRDGSSNTQYLNSQCYYRSSTRGNGPTGVDWTTGYTSNNRGYILSTGNWCGVIVRPVVSLAGKMQDGTLLQIATTAPTWTPGATEATLNGNLYGLSKAKTPVRVGFVVGFTPQVTKADGTTVMVSNPADGAISAAFSPVEDNKEYYYRAFIQYNKDSICYASARQFGRAWVDLGLPSGTLWSNVNIGAASPDMDGNYYAWGETATKEKYTDDTYRWLVENTQIQPDHLRDVQATRYDPAAVNWSCTAMQPSPADITELISNCNITQAVLYGMTGYLFTSKTNGNSIFMAKSGWKGTAYNDYGTLEHHLASAIGQDSYQSYMIQNGQLSQEHTRRDALPVRPVSKTNATATDGSPLYIRTLPARKQYDGTVETDTLRAVARGSVGTTPVGIVWWKDGTDRASGTSVALTPDADGHMQTIIRGLEAGTTYAFQAYAGEGNTIGYGDTLYVDAVGLVDLGLSVRWANVNIEAASAEDGGTFYQWGAIVPYRYKNQYYTGTDNLSVDQGNDTAAKLWGAAYRMPTKEEMQELIDKCTWTKQTRHGLWGYLVTSKQEGYTDRSIFIPEPGWMGEAYIHDYIENSNSFTDYWTATADGTSSWRLDTVGKQLRITRAGRDARGFLIRPVGINEAYAVSTTNCDWTIGATTATLSGSAIATTQPTGAAEYGFAIGDTPDVDASTATTKILASQHSGNAFSATCSYDGSAKYFRAYVKVGDAYYQGRVMSISAARLLDVAFRADNTAVDVSPSLLPSKTTGTPAVAWSDTYKRNEATLSNHYGYDPSQYYAFDFRNNADVGAALQKSLSMEVMIKMDEPTSTDEADILSDYQYGGCGIYIGDSNKTICTSYYIGGAYRACRSTITPQTGQYYHILSVYSQEDGKITLYVNGEQAATLDVSGALTLPSQQACRFMVSGNPSYDGNYSNCGWPGTISVARIYDKALTADEVKTLYDNMTK